MDAFYQTINIAMKKEANLRASYAICVSMLIILVQSSLVVTSIILHEVVVTPWNPDYFLSTTNTMTLL
eukprot:scaffold11332_cov199-Ochromonas_danica.AAC.1